MTRNSKIFVNQFIPFLMAHRAFDRYTSNFLASFPYLSLSRFIDVCEIAYWLDCAFDFADTPEGLDFWTRIHKEWQAVARHF